MARRTGSKPQLKSEPSRREPPQVAPFFANPHTFEILQERIFPRLLRANRPGAPIRVWVPQCGTGEEAYSLAICLHEFLGPIRRGKRVQIFATDQDTVSLNTARLGIYPPSRLNEVSQERLDHFFRKADDGFQVADYIRALCVFAPHAFLQDPPFSHLDLIDARSLSVSLLSGLEKRLLPVLHFALDPQGILLLPANEGAEWETPLFVSLDSASGAYARSTVPHLGPFDAKPTLSGAKEPTDLTPLLRRQIERLLLAHFASPHLILDDEGTVLESTGDVEPFFNRVTVPVGHPLWRLLPEALKGQVRSAWEDVARTGALIKTEEISLQGDRAARSFSFELIPFRCQITGRRFYLLCFLESKQASQGASRRPQLDASEGEPGKDELACLRDELTATKAELERIIRKQEQTNLELSSTNEVIQLSNEELQSTNEELETAKEELQSTNEELTTLNEELQNRNVELAQAKNDLSSLILSLNFPVVVLANDLSVRYFTPQADRIFKLIPADIGRPITDLKPQLPLPDLRPIVHAVLENLEPREVTLRGPDGAPVFLHVRPYRSLEQRIEGVLLLLAEPGPKPFSAPPTAEFPEPHEGDPPAPLTS